MISLVVEPNKKISYASVEELLLFFNAAFSFQMLKNKCTGVLQFMT